MKTRHLLLTFSALALTPAASTPMGGDQPAPTGTHEDTHTAQTSPDTRQEERPVAILATGTNNGANVRGETEEMIKRLQDSGYRVVVVPPRNAANARPGLDLRPLYRAVTAAANATGAEIVEARRWDRDGYHIHMDEARRIGRLYQGAPTFGDSNSVRINAGTGGHCVGVAGMTTTEIITTQHPVADDAARMNCRRLRDFPGLRR